MKTKFLLAWPSKNTDPKKAFKHKAYYELCADYLERIRRYSPCELEIVGAEALSGVKKPGSRLWVCALNSKKSVLSSEQLADKLSGLLDQGVRSHQILIGGPNGIPEKTLAQIEPDFIWSFGALTYPHELAALIACEQIYRAWTIIRHLPYHGGH